MSRFFVIQITIKVLSLLECSLPKTFALETDGDYWCLHTDGHIHLGEDHCPDDFESQNRHMFRSVKHEDNQLVPVGNCAIQSAYDDSFLLMAGELKKGDRNDPDRTEYHFEANDVGGGKVNMFSRGKKSISKKRWSSCKSKGMVRLWKFLSFYC